MRAAVVFSKERAPDTLSNLAVKELGIWAEAIAEGFDDDGVRIPADPRTRL